jgi:hypothetical protein
VDTPSGLRPKVFVVVPQVPGHVLRAALIPRPVVGNAGDAAKGVPGIGSRRVHLADDRVLGALDPGQRGHGAANPVTAAVGTDWLE